MLVTFGARAAAEASHVGCALLLRCEVVLQLVVVGSDGVS